jgi:hypothetical protein
MKNIGRISCVPPKMLKFWVSEDKILRVYQQWFGVGDDDDPWGAVAISNKEFI